MEVSRDDSALTDYNGHPSGWLFFCEGHNDIPHSPSLSNQIFFLMQTQRIPLAKFDINIRPTAIDSDGQIRRVILNGVDVAVSRFTEMEHGFSKHDYVLMVTDLYRCIVKATVHERHDSIAQYGFERERERFYEKNLLMNKLDAANKKITTLEKDLKQAQSTNSEMMKTLVALKRVNHLLNKENIRLLDSM